MAILAKLKNDYLQAGFNDIIIKPINKDTLLNIINTNN